MSFHHPMPPLLPGRVEIENRLSITGYRFVTIGIREKPMVYRKDRYVWGAVLFRTTRPEVVGGAIVRRSERLYWTSQAAAMEEVVAERRRQRQHVNRAVRQPSQLRCCGENDVSSPWVN